MDTRPTIATAAKPGDLVKSRWSSSGTIWRVEKVRGSILDVVSLASGRRSTRRATDFVTTPADTPPPRALTRVPGHELRGEGAPHMRGERRGTHQRTSRAWSAAGTGYAVCSCGATSAVLPSGARRKAWHRDHKRDVLAQQ